MEAHRSFNRTDENSVAGAGTPGWRRRLPLLVAAGVVVVLAAAWFLMHGRSAPPARSGGEQAPHVTVIVPGKRPVTSTITATGSMTAQRDMPVGVAGEGGMVTRVLAEPGDWVRRGQVLAVIDRQVQVQQAGSTAAQVRVAEADARLAEAQLRRAQSLVNEGFISKADIDQRTATRDAAVARVAVSRAQLGEQQARIGRLNVVAPYAGLVLTRAVEAGQVVSGGNTPLFRIAEDGVMELQARLAEQDIALLKIGATAQVQPVGGTQSYPGRIRQLSPIIDANSRQGIAKITVGYNTAFRPGGFGTARISGATVIAPVLPESAVQSDEKGNFVYIVGKDNRLRRQDVTIGEVDDQGVSIVRGLQGSEQVVASAGAFVNSGDKIVPELQRTQR